MKASLMAIRSVGAELANRIFYPVIIGSIIASAILVGVIIWLTTLSQWWLLLAVPVVMLICIGIGVLVVVKLTIKAVTPPQSTVQKQQTKQFVDQLQRVSDAMQTPKIILLFRIVRDIAAPREGGFIGTLATDTTSLKRAFNDLQKTFL